jgi:hypothetical protein
LFIFKSSFDIQNFVQKYHYLPTLFKNTEFLAIDEKFLKNFFKHHFYSSIEIILRKKNFENQKWRF